MQDEHLNDERQFLFHENLIKDSPLTTFDGKRKKNTHGEEESRQNESTETEARRQKGK